jgi:hypothetical protein
MFTPCRSPFNNQLPSLSLKLGKTHRSTKSHRRNQPLSISKSSRTDVWDLKFLRGTFELPRVSTESTKAAIWHRHTRTRPPMSSSPGCPAPMSAFPEVNSVSGRQRYQPTFKPVYAENVDSHPLRRLDPDKCKEQNEQGDVTSPSLPLRV